MPHTSGVAPLRYDTSSLRCRCALALALARPLTPFDLEAYLSFHFTKVGPQTRLMLETYARLAEKSALSSAALRLLPGVAIFPRDSVSAGLTRLRDPFPLDDPEKGLTTEAVRAEFGDALPTRHLGLVLRFARSAVGAERLGAGQARPENSDISILEKTEQRYLAPTCPKPRM